MNHCRAISSAKPVDSTPKHAGDEPRRIFLWVGRINDLMLARKLCHDAVVGDLELYISQEIGDHGEALATEVYLLKFSEVTDDYVVLTRIGIDEYLDDGPPARFMINLRYSRVEQSTDFESVVVVRGGCL